MGWGKRESKGSKWHWVTLQWGRERVPGRLRAVTWPAARRPAGWAPRPRGRSAAPRCRADTTSSWAPKRRGSPTEILSRPGSSLRGGPVTPARLLCPGVLSGRGGATTAPGPRVCGGQQAAFASALTESAFQRLGVLGSAPFPSERREEGSTEAHAPHDCQCGSSGLSSLEQNWFSLSSVALYLLKTDFSITYSFNLWTIRSLQFFYNLVFLWSNFQTPSLNNHLSFKMYFK